MGRTARAGKTGKAVTLVSQYDVEIFQKIETLIGRKLDEYPASKEHALKLYESVNEAQRQATLEMKDAEYLKKEDAEGKDDGEVNEDANLFQKRTYKQSKAGKIALSGPKSFARKRKRIA